MPTIYFWSSILIHRNIRFSFTFIIRPISTFVSKWFSVIFRNDFRSSDFFIYSPAGRRTFLVDLIRFYFLIFGLLPEIARTFARPATSSSYFIEGDKSASSTNRCDLQNHKILQLRPQEDNQRKSNHLVTWTNRRRRWPPIQLKADLPDGHERSVF